MGEVFLATDSRLDRKVAIKILPAEYAENADRLRRFEQEAKTLACLDHPNILSIFEVGTENGVPYLVSQYLEGTTLREELNRGALPQRKALQYALQIAQGLAAAHAKGLIHRDLKPENIFVTNEGQLKILDFGLAKLRHSPPSDAANQKSQIASDILTVMQKTEPGVVLGTVGYMSPEQVRGEEADHRSDIFALGCIFYEMLSGQRAFRKETSAETMTAILKDDPGDLIESGTKISLAAGKIAARCLEKSPERRFHSAHDLAFALESVTGSGISEFQQTRPPTRASRRVREMVGWTSALVLLVLLILIGWQRRATVQNPVPLPAFSVLQLAFPEKITLNVGTAIGTPIAVSPDGRAIAFVGTGSNDVKEIFIRPLDQAEARPLPGTDGAFAPFFSEDGTYVGFFAGWDSKLRAVPVAGGQAKVLSPIVPYPHGVSWRGSELIFNRAPAKDEGLVRLKLEGDDPPTVFSQPTTNELNHFWPQILPGNEAVLYTSRVSGNAQESQIVVRSLKDPSRRVRIGQGALGRYTASGHIVYSQGGALWAVGFDRSKFEMRGKAQRVREGVMINPFSGVELFDVSEGGNGTLAYVAATTNGIGRRLAWLTRSNSWEELEFPPDAYQDLSVKPDGTSAAIRIGDLGADIWILDLTPGSRRRQRLISHPRNDHIPTWSPDGQWLYFGSDRLGWPGVFRQRADGFSESETLVSDRDRVILGHDISPDQRTLVYVRGYAGVNADIMIMRLDGGGKAEPFLETPFDEVNPAFSPDGKWLAFNTDANQKGRFDVYVTSFPDKRIVKQVSEDGGGETKWSPKGGELFFRKDNDLMVVTFDADVEFRPSRPRPLIRMPAWVQTYDVAPDAQRFLVVADDPEPSALKQLVVVQNWFDELRRLAPP